MANIELNIGRSTLDDLFKTDEGRNTEEIKPIDISELKPFEEQPFKVLLDSSMDELVQSIKESGVLSPIVARPHKDGGYEILSGHRRVKACEIAGIEKVPVVVKNLDDDTARILLVDSNLQRENILPSEKAYAYQMKLEAMKRKAGRPSQENFVQIGQNKSAVDSRKELASQTGESSVQIQRYIRLTELIYQILDMVDNKEIAMNAAVELSYLGSKEQSEIYDIMTKEEKAPSIEQAKELRQLSVDGRLTSDVALEVMRKEKPEKMKVTLSDDKLKKYFPRSYSNKQIEDTILKLIENWHRKRKQEKER